MFKSDRDWQEWGEREPYFSVLRDRRFRLSSLADHRDVFFESGRAQVDALLARAEHQFGRFRRRRALDFGCGVGRLSLPLATQFADVIGLDVASSMLEEARANAKSKGLSNIKFGLTDDDLTGLDGHFDFVVSLIVLQHIPVSRGLIILRGLFDRVDQGGVAAIHVCIDRHDTVAQRMSNWLRLNVPGVHPLLNLLLKRSFGEPMMQMNAYSLGAIIELAQSAGFGPCLVELQRHGRFMTAQLLMRRERR